MAGEEGAVCGGRWERRQLVEDDRSSGRGAEGAQCGGRSGGGAHSPYLGLILAVLSSLFFSLCSVIVKRLVHIHPAQLAAFRFAGVLLGALPVAVYRKERVFPRGKRTVLLLRSLVGTTSLMLSFYAFRHMALGDASVIIFSVPVFVVVCAAAVLEEPCSRLDGVTLCLTLGGVVVIARPSVLSSDDGDGVEQSAGGVMSSHRGGVAAAVVSTLLAANAYVLLRLLKDVHYSVVMLNFGAVALVETALVCWALSVLCWPPCGHDRYLLLALALLSFGGQMLLTQSLQVERAGPVSVARSADIVFAFLWQALLFGQPPSLHSLLGAVLVTSSILLTALTRWALTLPSHSSLRSVLLLLSPEQPP